jgi:hypothetical protein
VPRIEGKKTPAGTGIRTAAGLVRTTQKVAITPGFVAR